MSVPGVWAIMNKAGLHFNMLLWLGKEEECGSYRPNRSTYRLFYVVQFPMKLVDSVRGSWSTNDCHPRAAGHRIIMGCRAGWAGTGNFR